MESLSVMKIGHKDGEALAQVAQRSCGCPSLAVFKARLDGALSSLV